MHCQCRPSSRLIHSSPLVVPKYTPTGSSRRRTSPGASPSTTPAVAGRPLSRGAASSRRRRASHTPPACRRGWCAARPSCRPSGRPRRCRRRADARPSEADVADLRGHVAPMFSQRSPAGRGGRCRSGSAGRAGPDCSGTGARSAGRGSQGHVARSKPSTTSSRRAAARSSAAVDATRARRRPTSRSTDARVARVDDDRVQLRPVRRAVLHAAHPLRYCGSSLMHENGAQVTPPSAERNSPCGEVPAYQTPARRRARRQPEGVIDRAPGRPSPEAGRAKAGGCALPSSVGRGRSSGRSSARGGRSSPPRAACGRRAGRAPDG
jgi:hypothetical protein